jgi:hypothetical protein
LLTRDRRRAVDATEIDGDLSSGAETAIERAAGSLRPAGKANEGERNDQQSEGIPTPPVHKATLFRIQTISHDHTPAP